jgi:hypothetical protein
MLPTRFSITPGCGLHPKEKLSRLSNAQSHFLRSFADQTTSEIAAIQSANPATPITISRVPLEYVD